VDALREALWPDDDLTEADAEAILAEPELLVLVARTEAGEAIGFAEAAIRHDYVNGCDTSPVLFIEGIYVAPKHRGHGIARALADRAGQWGRAFGCSEFASDALLENSDSHAFHAAIGFAETERVVYFRRAL
jgi:aminoglycoside 6'-N-acetyltransferase I